jgi:hypothetical protein
MQQCRQIRIGFVKHSEIWKHFKLNKADKSKVKCNICPNTFNYLGSTSNFWRHMTTAHKIDVSETGGKSSQSAKSSATDNSLMSIQKSFVRNPEPLKKVLARMVSLDRLPFNTIANSADIRGGLLAQGYKAPCCNFAIRSAVKQYAEDVKIN